MPVIFRELELIVKVPAALPKVALVIVKLCGRVKVTPLVPTLATNEPVRLKRFAPTEKAIAAAEV